MDLQRALFIIASVHTDYDERCGWTLRAGVMRPEWYSGFSQAEYMQAWETLRMYLHMNVNPAPTPA